MPPTAAMTIRNPARLRERCGVTTAEKSAGSAGWNSAVGPLRDVIEVHYRSNMGRKANPTATKVKPGKASPRAKPKRGSDPAPTLPAGEGEGGGAAETQNPPPTQGPGAGRREGGLSPAPAPPPRSRAATPNL